MSLEISSKLNSHSLGVVIHGSRGRIVLDFRLEKGRFDLGELVVSLKCGFKRQPGVLVVELQVYTAFREVCNC